MKLRNALVLTLAVLGLSAQAATETSTDLASLGLNRYPVKNPLFSFHFLLSPQVMGNYQMDIHGAAPSMGKFVSEVAINVQPLHIAGVWGIGPVLDVIAPYSTRPGVPSPMQYAVSIGGEIRYQARFYDRQPLIPTVSYSYKYMNYRLADRSQGGIPIQEPSLGLWVNLNWLDPGVANSFRREIGIQRTYLMVEYRRVVSSPNADQSDVVLSGDLFQTGLRFEF